MATQQIFKSAGRGVTATSVNHAGGSAYELDARTALAQLAATGCFGSTYYVTGEEQLEQTLKFAGACDVEFVAKVAIYARERGHMKDMPAVLLAHLCTRGPEGAAAAKAAFSRVIDNGRMLRNFVQVLRSGQLGRKSLGTAPKKMVQNWLAGRTPFQLFRDSVGNDPSLADVIKMVHPQPSNDEQRAMYGYLIGKPHDAERLPEAVRLFEAWKRGEGNGEVPRIPSRMLQGLPLGTKEWTAIARNARWHETRMNLNTFDRHGVFADSEMVDLVAKRLADPDEVRGAKAFPYQLLMAWNAASNVPAPLHEALQDAMEVAVENVPKLDGRVVVCTDVSGSMGGPVTGYRHGATTSARCADVAGLITATLLRNNPLATVVPFAEEVRQLRINPRDSVMSIANTLASIYGGGTACSAPLRQLNRSKAKVDAVIFVSDNESWMDSGGNQGWYGGTAMLQEWDALRKRNPNAKLVCIDMTPNVHKQAIDRQDILNVGGFSDAVFDVVAQFVNSGGEPWAKLIDKIEI